jgi:hypothetical protein
MARDSDGRTGVSVNAETMMVLENVRKMMKEQLGITPSYTQAIQYVANYYAKDNVTLSHSVPTQTEGEHDE